MTELFCEVDGVFALQSGRFSRPEPADQLHRPHSVDSGRGRRHGTCSGDGYFVFLSALPPGEHTLHFGECDPIKWPEDPVDISGRST